jgi:hypothetical protein
MSDPTDLANYLQSLGLQENRLDYHELTVEYPVLELILPEAGISPCLRPPQNIEFREQPDESKYHLPQTGMDFTIRLPLAYAQPNLFSSNPASISTAIQSLSTSPGHSILQIASYSSRSDGESLIFRLVTENPVNGQYTITTENDLSSLEWEAERSAPNAQKWTRLAHDLINRASDRAYFHVQDELRLYSWYLKSIKTERWGWAREFGSVAGSGLVSCGHSQAIGLRPMDCPKFLNDHSARAINELACEICALCVPSLWASEEDLRQRRLFQEAKFRVEFSAREGFWRQLEERHLEAPVQQLPVQLSSKLLYDALKHALPSIRVPDTACPRALQWLSSKEVTVAMLHLLGKFDLSNGAVISATSPHELEKSLLGLFEDCLNEILVKNGRSARGSESLPEVWVSLLRLWMARTVMLVLVPGYDGRDIAAVFGEGGKEGLLVGDGVGKVMDELEAMFSNARLE